MTFLYAVTLKTWEFWEKIEDYELFQCLKCIFAYVNQFI